MAMGSPFEIMVCCPVSKLTETSKRSRMQSFLISGLNSGERHSRWLRLGVSEQDTKEVLDGIGFLVGSARGVSMP